MNQKKTTQTIISVTGFDLVLFGKNHEQGLNLMFTSSKFKTKLNKI